VIASSTARLVAALVLLTVAGGAIAAVGAGERSPAAGPEIELTGASKALTIHNSRRGQAVVEGANLVPGDWRRGQVTVGVASSARMTLAADRVRVKPGPNGGVLAEGLVVRIRVIGGGSRSYETVYNGPLTGLGEQALGRWQAHERHRFRVRVSFPSSAGPQDSLQGAGTGFRLVWRATP
jgi:hypothetical protein